MRSLVVLLLAACAPQMQPSCDVESQLAADVAQVNATDCGSVLDGVDGGLGPAMQHGHDCVLDAIARSQAFRFLYADPQSGLTAGIDGTYVGGRLQLKWYSAGAPDSKMLSVQTCTEGIKAAPSCTPSPGVPCLQCVTPMGALLCSP